MNESGSDYPSAEVATWGLVYPGTVKDQFRSQGHTAIASAVV